MSGPTDVAGSLRDVPDADRPSVDAIVSVAIALEERTIADLPAEARRLARPYLIQLLRQAADRFEAEPGGAA